MKDVYPVLKEPDPYRAAYFFIRYLFTMEISKSERKKGIEKSFQDYLNIIMIGDVFLFQNIANESIINTARLTSKSLNSYRFAR